MNISCIILASGSSQRFGSDKLLASVREGEPMLVTTVKLCMSVFSKIYVVLPVEDKELRKHLPLPSLTVVDNFCAKKGMSESIKAGVRSIEEESAYIVMLADMPCVKQKTLLAIKDKLNLPSYRSAGFKCVQKKERIVVPFYKTKRGNPIAFGSFYKDELLVLDGDVGAKNIVKNFQANIVPVDTGDFGVIQDIDDSVSFRKAKHLLAERRNTVLSK